MNKIALIFIVLGFNFGVFSQVRVDRDQSAKNEFADLNFFYKGKGMIISPDLIKMYELLRRTGVGLDDAGKINERWGLNVVDKKAVGLFNVPYKKMDVGVLGCVACHSGRAAGEWIVGLGNKNIDVGQVGKDAYVLEMLWGSVPRINKPEFRKLHNQALKFAKVLKNDDINNLTQGLVPTSAIKSWFYEVSKTPLPKNFGRGQVKVPHLWGYGEKRKSGSFWDGFADGVLPGWAVAVELRGGQSVENVREYIKDVHHAEDALADFLPPKYPFKVDEVSAIRGEKLFNSSCVKCHGSHERDENGLPIFKSPKLIPWKVVKTDRERIDLVSEDFLALVDTSPLNDLMKYKKEAIESRGYIAPRLWGVWSRFPYLHNASVPTLMDLLSPVNERPVVFDLYRAGEKERFDEKNLGLLIERNKSSRDYKKLARQASRGDRKIYDVSRVGHSNVGHEYSFYKELTKKDKEDLIEYLKTL